MKLTLEEFAKAKGFEPGQIAQFGVSENKGRIIIHYRDEDGNLYARWRIRDDTEDGKGFAWNRGPAKVIPYGLNRPIPYLKKIVWVVEGESDCWALWLHEIPALGIPGATNVGCLKLEHLRDVDSVFVVQERDEAGERFPHRVAQSLYDQGYCGQVFRIELPAKDARELYVSRNGSFRSALTEAYRNRILVERPTISLPLLDIRTLGSYEAAPVRWLWNERIPLGAISILCGDPGLGKTFITLAIAAALTTGTSLPGGSPIEPRDVLIWNGEDAADHTLKPRFVACGGNVDRIHVIGGVTEDGQKTPFRLAHVPLLMASLERLPNVGLVILDPIMSLMDKVDTHIDAEVRVKLQPLVEFAEKSSTAVLLVAHTNKGTQSFALHRLGGSAGFGALARSVMFAGIHAITGQRGIDTKKHNLSSTDPSPVEFALVDGQVIWKGFNPALKIEALWSSYQRANRGSQGSIARTFLRHTLAEGPMRAKDILRMADERGLAEKTLQVAKKALGIVASRVGLGGEGYWLWALPSEEPGEDDSPKVATSAPKVAESPLLLETTIYKDSRIPSLDSKGKYDDSDTPEISKVASYQDGGSDNDRPMTKAEEDALLAELDQSSFFTAKG